MRVGYAGRMNGEQLRERREGLGMTQAELARKLGMYQTTISQWEQGRKGIRHPRMLDLALRALERERDERGDG